MIVIQENRSFNDFFATFPGADGTTVGKVAAAPNCRPPIPVTTALFGNRRNAESDSFTAHQDLIRGDTIYQRDRAMIDLPSDGANWWGCDAPPGTRTSYVTSAGVEFKGKGPYPCTKHFRKKYPTLRDLLDAKGISWKYYVPPGKNTANGKMFNAFDLVRPVRNGPEWGTNVVWPETTIFNDIDAQQLPAVSWVIPDAQNSDHPDSSSKDTGPSWVASIVNAIGESSYWKSTAIVILWDDWGGIYDNKAPKILDYGGLGFRVPTIIVSPYALAGHISTTNYEFGSILRYVEDNWNLGNLGTTDTRGKSIIDSFNYGQSPITFVPIGSKYKKSYFLHQRPSLFPVDTDM